MVILSTIIVIFRKKATKHAAKSAITPPEEFNFVENHQEYDTTAETQTLFTTDAEADITIHFIAILHSNIMCSFGLTTHMAKTLGRNKQADICLNKNDAKLSSIHCTIEWDGNDLYVKDVGSTNGTSIDGVPIKPNTWHKLPNESTIRIGEYEYRVITETI